MDDVTDDQADEACGYTGIDHRDLVKALMQRGHDRDKILAMSPEQRFHEYCQWEGLLGYGSHLLRVAAHCRVVLDDHGPLPEVRT